MVRLDGMMVPDGWSNHRRCPVYGHFLLSVTAMRHPASIIRSLVVALTLVGCAAASATNESVQPGSLDDDTSGPNPLAAYFITPELCLDATGPDCRALRLGDAHLTLSSPGVGTLYSCSAANPSAPGSVRSLITWIDDAAGTWDLLRKPFLPAGGFSPGIGTASVSESGSDRTIIVSNLPVDGKIGNWPMTQYSLLSTIDRNPGIPTARTYTFTLPIAPQEAAAPSCVSLGAIGVTLNGVVLFNAADARGNDAVAHEIVDAFGGHPARSDYHYHFVPERLDVLPFEDGHSGLVGYIRDGFGLYGYRGAGGVELRNTDLDQCHGHSHAPIGYHYHATLEYPYTIGCYRGTPR
jgi:hypothetical protein